MFARLLTCAAAVCAVLAAQEFRATITGTVTDAQGAVVPNATIRITNTETNATVTTISNVSGVYTAPFLPPGTYNLTAGVQGFKTAVRNDIELRVGDRLQIDITLEVGTMSEQVTVSAAAELLETASASRGQVINTRSVQDLPLLGRNPFMLATLSTGVQYIPALASRSNRPFDNGGMDNFSMNGGRQFTNEFLLDGVPNTNVEQTQPSNLSFVPSPDATEEFKVQTNTYDAQYGRTGGGVVNVSLKSGSNQVHGSLYHYFRNDKLNANQFESNLQGTKKGAFRWNQPGLMFSGPVYLPKIYDGRNKTFFMYSWEKILSSIPFPQTYTVPTAAQRAGDFSTTLQANGQPITIYDPLTTRMEGSSYVRTPFAGNRIPADRMDPVARKLLEFVPLPNNPGNITGQFNFITDQNPRTDEYDQHIIRVDQQLGSNHKFFARYVRGNRHEVNSLAGFPRPASPWYTHWRVNQGGNFDMTNTVSPTTVLAFRYGYIRHQFAIARYADGFDTAQLGFPSSLVAQLPRLFFPEIAASEYTTFGTQGSNFTFSDTHSISETVNKVLGAHSLKFGAEFRVMFNNQQNPTSSMGQFAFNRGFTQRDPLRGDSASGNSIASMLLGFPASGSVPWNVAPAFSNRYYVLFLQDDWRATRRLTLNLGFRWDYESPQSERFNQQNRGFDPAIASPLRVPGLDLKGGLRFVDDKNRLPYKRDLNNLQPRVGAAFQLRPTSVLRGGYGLYYLPTFDHGFTNGFSQSTPFVSSVDGGLTPANRLSNPYPAGIDRPVGSSLGPATFLGRSFSFGYTDREIPRVHQFSFGIQQELPFRILVDASYVGSRTQQLQTAININDITAQQLGLGNDLLTQVPNPFQGRLPGTAFNGTTITRRQLLRPFPQFDNITEEKRSIGKQWYNSLQLRVEKRYSSGVHFLASYTFSKTIEAIGYLNPQDGIGNLARVLHDQDTPHRLVLSGSWELPIFRKGSHAVLRQAFGGWQINTITTIQSGLPIATPASTYSTGVNPKLDNPTRARWFNTCTLTVQGTRQNCASADERPAFAIQPPFTLRTLSVRFPNIRTRREPIVDLSVFKQFLVTETLRLQFRAEAFNLTNTPWFGAPGTGVTAANFGVVSPAQANDPRNVQLALKLVF